MRTCKICNVEKNYNKFTTILKAGKVYYSWTCKPSARGKTTQQLGSESERIANSLLFSSNPVALH